MRKLLIKVQKQPAESKIEIKPEPNDESEEECCKQLEEDAILRPGEIVSCDDAPVIGWIRYLLHIP